MKRTIIAVSFLLAAGLLTACNKAKNEVLPDGTKLFGEVTLRDGTRTAERVESPDGHKNFNETWLMDGSVKVGRSEFPNGEKQFDVTVLPDGTVKEGRAEYPNGEKQFDVTGFKGRVSKVGRSESSNGEKSFDVTVLPDKTIKIGRVELPNGEKHFDVTQLLDGTQTAERVESPNGGKKFNVTWLKDGTQVEKTPESNPSGSETAKPAEETCEVLAVGLMQKSAPSREQYANHVTEAAGEKLGPGILFASAAGENNKYLLLVATPENEATLREFASAMIRSKTTRTTFCLEGFDEVQFLVRYGDGDSQKLVKRFKPSFQETFHYLRQTSLARPE